MNFFIAIGVVLVVLAFVELVRAAVARAGSVDVTRFALVAIGFSGRRAWRVAAIAVGPVATYVAIVVIAFVAYCGEGFPDSRIYVDGLLPQHDAVGKLALDDQVLSVDDQPVAGARDIGAVVGRKHGAPVIVTVMRDGASRDIELAPTRTNDAWRLGIVLRRGRTTDLGASAKYALRYPKDMAIGILDGLVGVITAREEAEIGGPTRIAEELRWIQPTWTNIAWVSALLATYLMLALLVIDLTRIVLLLLRGERVEPK